MTRREDNQHINVNPDRFTTTLTADESTGRCEQRPLVVSVRDTGRFPVTTREKNITDGANKHVN